MNKYYILDNVKYKLVNGTNRDVSIPTMELLDLRVQYVVDNLIITFDCIGKLGIEMSELNERAKTNTKKEGFVFNRLESFLNRNDIAESGFFVLTNDSKEYGATALLFNEYLEDISDVLKSDLLILPSSIHECIIGEFDEYVEENLNYFKQMVLEVNNEFVSKEDILSDNIYKYDRNIHKLILLQGGNEYKRIYDTEIQKIIKKKRI